MIRFTPVNRWYRERFGTRVQRLPLYAGSSCPNRDGTKGRGGCLYCDARGSAADNLNLQAPLKTQFQEGLETIRRRYPKALILPYFQPFTTTYANPVRFAELLRPIFKEPDVVGISVGTRPDCLAPPWIDLFTSLGENYYVEVELGLESARDETLQGMNRCHDVTDFDDAVKNLDRVGLNVVAHVILGLPGESETHWEATARHLSASSIHGVKIHNLHIMASSPMARMYGLRPGDTLEGGEVLTSSSLPDLHVLTLDGYARALTRFLFSLSEHMVLYRLTGERFSEDFLGPRWAAEKTTSRERLLALLKEWDIMIE